MDQSNDDSKWEILQREDKQFSSIE